MVSGYPPSEKMTPTLKHVYRTYEVSRYTCTHSTLDLDSLRKNLYERFNSPEASDSAISLIHHIVVVFQIVVLLMLDDVAAEAPGCQGLFRVLAAPQSINGTKASGGDLGIRLEPEISKRRSSGKTTIQRG